MKVTLRELKNNESVKRNLEKVGKFAAKTSKVVAEKNKGSCNFFK